MQSLSPLAQPLPTCRGAPQGARRWRFPGACSHALSPPRHGASAFAETGRVVPSPGRGKIAPPAGAVPGQSFGAAERCLALISPFGWTRGRAGGTLRASLARASRRDGFEPFGSRRAQTVHSLNAGPDAARSCRRRRPGPGDRHRRCRAVDGGGAGRSRGVRTSLPALPPTGARLCAQADRAARSGGGRCGGHDDDSLAQGWRV